MINQENVDLGQLGWQDNTKVDTTEKEGTTKIELDNQVDLVSRENYIVPDTRYLAGANTGYVQGLKQFLSKPVQLAYGNFSTSDVAAHRLWNFGLTVSNLFLNSTANGASVWGNKVSGFLGIRATVRIHLIVNAQPFQQGRYFLALWPCMYDVTATYDRIGDGSQTRSLTTQTQLPRAEVDLCTASEVIFDIPYLNLNTHMNLLSGEGSWGNISLLCYLPFMTGTGGTQSAPYQIYCSLHDVDLVCPTRPITVAQVDSQAAPVKAQMAKNLPRKGKVAEEVIEEGPVSSFLNKVSTVADYWTGIPVVSSYAAPLSWCSSLIARSAAVFGWSKPRNELVIQRMNNTMGQYQQNCDGVENAFSIGLFSTNKVQVMPSLGGTDIDEMSIDFIKQQPAWVNNFAMTTTQTAQSLIMSLSTAPLYQSATTGKSNTL